MKDIKILTKCVQSLDERLLVIEMLLAKLGKEVKQELTLEQRIEEIRNNAIKAIKDLTAE